MYEELTPEEFLLDDEELETPDVPAEEEEDEDEEPAATEEEPM